MRAIPRLALLMGVFLLPAGPIQAQTNYTLQSIMRLGDPAGDLLIQAPDGYFDVGTLNNRGQLVFSAADTEISEALIQYSNDQFTPIAAGGEPAPGGRWDTNIRFMPSVRMNQQGDAVFSAGVFVGGTPQFTSHLWSFQSKQITPLIRPGTPASDNLVLEGTSVLPVINSSNAIALTAQMRTLSGDRTGDGVLFRTPAGQLIPIALPGQPLPGGGSVAQTCCPDLNNAGMVAFLARRQGDPVNAWSAYLWENGTVTPLIGVGAPATGGRVASIWSVWLNNANRSILMEASISALGGGVGLYRFTGGQMIPIAVPGQTMPGGGRLRLENGPSYANDHGQHAFLAELDGGFTAAYLIGTDGRLSRVLKSGDTTEVGRITNVGQGTGAMMNGGAGLSVGTGAGASFGIGLNSRGQLALTVGIDGGADALVLLTPRGR